MDESSALNETAPAVFANQPYMTRVDDLNVDEAVEILLNPDMTRISTAPAVLPRAGDVYVYVLDGYAKSDISRIRSDGYTWYSCSGKVIRAKTSGLRVQKYYWTWQNTSDTGDHRFKRQEFRLLQEAAQGQREKDIGAFVIILHYLGDDKVTSSPSGEEIANGLQAKSTRARRSRIVNPNLISQGRISLSSASPAVTVVNNDAHETYAAVNSISSLEEKSSAHLRVDRRSELISATPLSVPRTFRSINHLKRPWQQSPSTEEGPSSTKKLSKNHLLGQQVEATLDALEGEDLFAARDEIYDFLRKWDKD